ncbi:M17 family metallopeptidase [Idiomarina sp. UBA4520]|uniref:M17 family metallopeptidase n=1 Tax=Idiomarina sp. UBA4520 TaxID=1946647 RepID=UPI000A8B24D2|nr:leucyl aminopeptidase family protein [Idiomarina sp. UBA4520]MBF38658.1 peptidase M17 [Idiomarinaceae bacterium]|tara:strand:- start:2986 stop:4530 length:1545 start_codon:yes stop_codon:yes gene_type:complete
MAFPKLDVVSSLADAYSKDGTDALIVIGHFDTIDDSALAEKIQQAKTTDQRVGSDVLLLQAEGVPGQRLVTAPTGPLNRDFDDVRQVFDAAHKAAKIAQDAGARHPVIALNNVDINDTRYQQAFLAAYLGVGQSLYQPLEAREAHGEEAIEPTENVTLVGELDADWAMAVEAGKRVARDLAGTEPERMAPPRFAEYCRQAFAHTPVKVSVIDDSQQLQHEYPLLAAVGRSSMAVERHRPCVIRLEYHGSQPERTVMFAGKGIVYDTGGADLKTGGHMAGMSRDKGGAAGVAGFMKTVAELQPEHLNVVAEIGAVRNSIGSDAFVADEIITGHSGKRVRIGNTDAEGRLIMADLLSHLREEAAQADGEHELYTVATLTGHAALAKGPYSALVPNGHARRQKLPDALFDAGETYGDPTEISWSRREDFDFVKGRTLCDDLLSSNNGPSATTPRGHQFPMAFLVGVSGLDNHGIDSSRPLSYIHIDIAGSGVEGGDWQHGKPTAAPVTCLAGHYLKK